MIELENSREMPIKYQTIILRDMVESDIADVIRWRTVETQWMDWDGPDMPWSAFDPEAYRARMTEALKQPVTGRRKSFQIETAEGVHIGMTNVYRMDENWKYLHDGPEGEGIGPVLGLSICESVYWSRGYGRQALAAFIRYFLEQGEREVYLQTWSGNVRMVRVAQALGFAVCNRFTGNRHIRGGVYDGLTFRLDLDKFHKYLSENP